MPTVRVNDVAIYYERHGAGAPLLFIAGLGANVCETPYLTESYARHFDYIIYDQRGCGRSDKPAGVYSMAAWADDAAALLDALGIESTAVYGSSMGGMVAQELALRHPQRVAALILGCTTGGAVRGERPAPETVQRMVANRALTGDAALAAGWSLGYSAAFIEANHDSLTAISRRAGRYGAPEDSYMRQVLAAAQHDAWDRLHAVACPTLILHGSDDLMIPAGNAHMLAERIPHAELRILEGMGHGYNLEAQDAADALVIDFVRRHASAAAEPSRALR